MKEILRESLHSSLKVKSKDIQDKFLETANTAFCPSTSSVTLTVNKFDL